MSAKAGDAFEHVRLLGPPMLDGEYVALGEHDLVHLHDYTRIYAVPGLYEHVVRERLQCRSPQVAADGFLRAVALAGLNPSSLAVLDVGAGTGLVGELLRRGGVERVIGTDALPAARTACLRDRPGVYRGYLLGDLGSRDSELHNALREQPPDGLVSAGAFGGTHAPPAALVNALAILPPGAPVALTIDERWMDRSDPDGFGFAVERLVNGGDLQLLERVRFRHRITTTGEPIFYELLVGTTGNEHARGYIVSAPQTTRSAMSIYAVVDPATGETIKEYPTITDDELRAAIGRADEAHRTWSASASVADRAALVRRVGELHVEQREALADIIVREMGKPVEQALAEVDFAGAIYEFYADNAEELMADEPIKLLDGEGSALVRRSSLGVLLGVMPWNFPYYQVARFAGPNLVIGNTILLKHAPQCPESAEAMARIFKDAGFPDGAYENIYASNEQIEWVIADPRVRGVSVTGSERAGAAVAEIAGRNLKKVVLELGGSDPFILLGTDDLDKTVEAAVAARLDNTGQSCNAAKRFIVLDEFYEPFLQKFTAAMTAARPGDPHSSETEVGPLSSKSAADRLEDQVRRAVDQGATVLAGGKRDGNFFEPTVLTDISPDNDAYREELFGPVAQVYRVSSEEEAVRLANDTPYGLGSYVMTTDPEQGRRVADQIDAGMVYVNLVGADGAELPFGGTKRSGFGRELGRFGADEFVNKKLIRIG